MITLNTRKYLKEVLLILSRYFTFFYLIAFCLLSFINSRAQRIIISIIHIAYRILCVLAI